MKFKFCYKFILIALFSILSLHSYGRSKNYLLSGPAKSQRASSLLFIENKGQITNANGSITSDILFTANSGDVKLFIKATGIYYQFEKTIYPDGIQMEQLKTKEWVSPGNMQIGIKRITHRISIELQGANQHPVVRKEMENIYKENFYLPHCPNGLKGVKSFERIVIEDIYPGIDWIIYSKGNFLEYDFLVHSNGEYEDIRLKISDADKVNITGSGDLLIGTSIGNIRETAPVCYIENRQIPARFVLFKDQTIGFKMALKKGVALRIDPSVSWASYYSGPNSIDDGYCCTTDKDENVYLSGFTNATSGIAIGGFQNNYSNDNFSGDAFLVKFDSSGNRQWATYYGGTGSEYGISLTTDNNDIYMAGYTNSINVISFNGFQNNFGGGNRDAFLVKFDEFGGRLWGTYYGGSNEDAGQSIEKDKFGNIYLAGFTKSINNISFGGFQNSPAGFEDVFLVKFNEQGMRLWGTYYGGINTDYGYDCCTDGTNVFIAGETTSTAGIADNGFQNIASSNSEAFLVKFDSAGVRIWGTYYGGTSWDYGRCCSADTSGNIYLSGHTSTYISSSIAYNGFQNTWGGYYDAFLVKFNSNGTRLWATYFGGSNFEYCYSTAIDNYGNIYLTGSTQSVSNIAHNGFQNIINSSGLGYKDAFIVKFNSNGQRIWASYYGGNNDDEGRSIATANSGNVYIAGYTWSSTGIAYNGFQNFYSSGGDAFIAKINGTNQTLPVSIVSFVPYRKAKNIMVEWTVAYESKIKTYEVEKSTDGFAFIKTGEILANNSIIYHWLDADAKKGNNFYRLRTIDMDGKTQYSRVIKLIISAGSSGFQVYPNPLTGNFITLSLINQPKGFYKIRLFNSLLQIMFSRQISHTEGNSNQKINLGPNLKRGSYTLQITAPDSIQQSIRIMVLK